MEMHNINARVRTMFANFIHSFFFCLRSKVLEPDFCSHIRNVDSAQAFRKARETDAFCNLDIVMHCRPNRCR